MKRVTLATLRELKRAGEKIACLTAYDYSFAALLERAGVDLIMVGDSLGMVVQGHDTTLPVSLAEMVYHSRCVARGVQRALLVADMPFMSYQASPEQALASAGRLMRRGGAQVVKLEGGAPMVETVRFLVARGVPVCAHLGLTPQSVHKLGGYRVQGRDTDDAERIRRDARALEEAGAGLLVLEAVPAALARTITRELSIPTIGIGAGPDCDGQILVLHDMLGIYPRPSPKFSRNFMDGAASIEDAVKNYVAAVKSRAFPGPEHSY
ncbi:MAG: 3-methyl-2-oxobutanoate hydroxymethyltransferase [Candidatus Muproteobacteria bacterium RIFCSPHIGHO2_02_FULL_65_16]|uniref:3-methyl-2-oxobutanoate hydroxymethyltransferase n=1 Tax=Candidatus Muproteobacteria bacterium RIFCSPHIGHO2_02_FULL_65_16 TaxID=1817766 RepID=A0A1F6TTR1_9PROT|nr:MAG: 3-methyl-2-oxobutanoate hydroxymethyltransferase [Candidatus Muproteobacteria bacterium RIFCSPHIGHO2_02_FULL_65_16]